MTISGSAADVGNSGSNTITSGTLTILTNDIILCMYAGEDNALAVKPLLITNSGTAMTWTSIAVTNTASNCVVQAWWAKSAGNENRTVTVTTSAGTAISKAIYCRVHTGANLTTPVPVGNVFSGVGGTDNSQSITPTTAGSALWMIVADWNQTNSFAAIANCTLENTRNVGGAYTATFIRPTTQPRTSAAAFTIGETDTSGKNAWIALEVALA